MLHRFRSALFVALLSCSSTAQDSTVSAPQSGGPWPGHWNQWRGPMRSGYAPKTPVWPDSIGEQRLIRRWRVPLGPSYSGPVVTPTLVVTTETSKKEEEVVRAFDRATGEERWSRSWKGSIQVPFFAARNGSWIRSTPIIDGDTVYVAGMRDVLVALDVATGDERWRRDFPTDLKVGVPTFGCVCSPMIQGDYLYLQAGGSFVKLDKKTGAMVWRSLEDGGGMMGGAFSSPVVATLAGREQIVVQGRLKLHAVDPASGTVLWEVPVRTDRGMNILTPLPVGDGIFTSAYGGRGHLFAVSPTEEGTLRVSEKWESRAQGYMTTPVQVGTHAYLYLRSKRFVAVDLASGELAWTSDAETSEYWSLVAQGTRILALTHDGELISIQADPSRFHVLERRRITDRETWAHLAVDGDQVLVRELDALTAYTWR